MRTGWLEFAPGNEFLGFTCAFLNGLRWSDWGANPTDYDLYMYDSAFNPIGGSFGDQTVVGPPLELTNPCASGLHYLAINRFDVGNGTAGDVLEVMFNGGLMQYWQNAFSASGPASDTASTGGLSGGAPSIHHSER